MMHKITKYSIDQTSFKSDLSKIILEIKQHTSTFLEMDIKNAPVSIINSIRRILMSEIPTMALEKIDIYENSGIIVDEMLAQRLGLIPCALNPDNYTFESEVEYTLDVHNNTNEPMNILSDNFILEEKIMESENRLKKGVLITILAPGQSIKLKAFATKNVALEHSKWSPVNPAVYRYHPQIKLKRDFFDEEAKELQKYFSEGVILLKQCGNNIKAVVGNERNETMNRSIFRNTKFCNDVELGFNPTHFIFTIETEVMDPLDLFKKAVYLLNNKAKTLKEDIVEFLTTNVEE
ncbi:DNA-directed RNA polymerases I and III subunit RPAC1 [Cucumispora dikerogammari]|nr:DNA-directed RNA polymerases I and III subunit RPAC1 [Cucumispora dikerogammari]